MWELSCPARDEAHTPCIGRQSLNHWTTRKVPNFCFSPVLYSITSEITISYFLACESPFLMDLYMSTAGVNILELFYYYLAHQAPLSMKFSRQGYWGVGSYSLLHGIFPTPGLNLGLLHCKWTLPSEPPGHPLLY